MTELALSKKQRTKKNAGGGRGSIPLRRRYVREQIEMKSKHGGKEMSTTTRTPEEIEELKATLAMPMRDRMARMKKFIDDLDVEAAINGTGTEEMRLSGTRILVASATEREESGDEDFGTALREEIRTSAILTPDEYGHDYPTHLDAEAEHDITVESIQTTAAEKGVSFADALRESDVEPERDLPWAGAKRPLPERTEEEQAELERTIKERMEQQKEHYRD
jgi:hypothetical protein